MDIHLFGPGFTSLSAGLPRWSFLALLPLSQARLLEIYNIVPVCDCAAVCSASLHFTASHRLGPPCLSWQVWSHCSFLRDLDLSLKLFITSTRSFHGVVISSGTFSPAELAMQNLRLLSLKSHAPCATERQGLLPKAVSQSCW